MKRIILAAVLAARVALADDSISVSAPSTGSFPNVISQALTTPGVVTNNATGLLGTVPLWDLGGTYITDAGSCTLSSGSCTVTVQKGTICQATEVTSALAVSASVSGTTLTINGTGSDVINYACGWGVSSGQCTLNGASPATCTVPVVPSTTGCIATDSSSVTVIQPTVTGTPSATLTLTGPNASTDVVSYLCGSFPATSICPLNAGSCSFKGGFVSSCVSSDVTSRRAVSSSSSLGTLTFQNAAGGATDTISYFCFGSNSGGAASTIPRWMTNNLTADDVWFRNLYIGTGRAQTGFTNSGVGDSYIWFGHSGTPNNAVGTFNRKTTGDTSGINFWTTGVANWSIGLFGALSTTDFLIYDSVNSRAVLDIIPNSGVTITAGPAATARAGLRNANTRNIDRNGSVSPVDCAGGGIAATVTQLVDGAMFTCATAQTLTMPTAQGASGIVQGLPAVPAIGDFFHFKMVSTASFAFTLAAGTGITLSGNVAVANGSTQWDCRITSITANSETATCYGGGGNGPSFGNFSAYNSANLGGATQLSSTKFDYASTLTADSNLTYEITGVGAGNYVARLCSDGTTCGAGNIYLTCTKACTDAAGTTTACTVTKAAVSAATTLTWEIGTACTTEPATNHLAHYTTP